MTKRNLISDPTPNSKQQQQTQTKLLSSRSYFNKRYLRKVVKNLQKHHKFAPQMCPNSVQSESAEVKKSTNMPTTTATTPTSAHSYRNLQRRRSSGNLDGASGNISCISGAIRFDSNQGNANSNNPSIRGSKHFSARKRNTITSGQILLTMLLLPAFVLDANSTVAAPTDATPLPAITANATTSFIAPFTNASTGSVSSARAADSTNAYKATTNCIAPETKAVTPTTTSAAAPSFSLISASTITNGLAAMVVAATKLSAPTPHPLLRPHPPPSAVSTPQPTSNSLFSFIATTMFARSDLPVELFTTETVMATTTANNNVESSSIGQPPPPSSDVLIEGFSIPTFLPPLPAFAMADLLAYTTTPASVAAITPAVARDSQDQLYLAAYQQNVPQHNLSMPPMNVTVQMGNNAYLPCNIHRMLNKPISWVRLRDGHILSVDQATFIADQRFQSIFQGEEDFTWSLQIKYVQNADEGWYECQVSTEPKLSAKVYLGVVVPHTELIGDQNRFVKAGSKVALHCIVRDTLDPPTYIIWLRGKTQITNDNHWGWYTEIDRTIFGNADSNQNTIGSLIIPFVRKGDSGNYTCQPSNSAPVSVDLHVLSGEYSASAIMSAASSYLVNGISPCRFLLLLALLLVPKT